MDDNFRVGHTGENGAGVGTGTVTGGDFKVKICTLRGLWGTEEKESLLTIVGNKSTWNASNEFKMFNNQSKLNFVFDKDKISTIESGTISLAEGAEISATMNVQGILPLDSNTFNLMTGSELTDNGANLVESQYLSVLTEGNNIVAKLNYMTELPEEPVTEGALQLNSDSLLFYSNIWDSKTKEEFTACLEENTDDVKSVTGGEMGKVFVQFTEAKNYIAFNFDAFNSSHADHPASLSGALSVPEPATCGMLLLGMFGLWRFCGRKKQVRVS